MLTWVNNVLGRACEAGLSPIIRLPPLVSLLIVSLVTSVVMLLVVARASDQKRLAESKRGMHAALFEIRLFNDDLSAVLRSLGDGLRHYALYLRLSLVPMLWLAIPLALVASHLQAYYGHAGLTPGEPAILKVELRRTPPEVPAPANVMVLDAPAEVRVETEAVRLSTSNEVLWRIVPTAEGEYTLIVRIGSATATKTLQVSSRPARRSPRRVSAGLLDQLLYPSEPPLSEDSPIASITLAYPEAGIQVAGWRLHWMIVYVALSLGCAFMIARKLGVTM